MSGGLSASFLKLLFSAAGRQPTALSYLANLSRPIFPESLLHARRHTRGLCQALGMLHRPEQTVPAFLEFPV